MKAPGNLMNTRKPRRGGLFIDRGRTTSPFFLFFGGAIVEASPQEDNHEHGTETPHLLCVRAAEKQKELIRGESLVYKQATPTGFPGAAIFRFWDLELGAWSLEFPAPHDRN